MINNLCEQIYGGEISDQPYYNCFFPLELSKSLADKHYIY